jgi:hypothetical protein
VTIVHTSILVYTQLHSSQEHVHHITIMLERHTSAVY